MLTALVLLTGAFIICCAFITRLPRGVTVNGVEVGGLTFDSAKRTLRQRVIEDLKGKELRICADERVYTFAYPEVDFLDDFADTLLSARRGGEYLSPVHYFLNGAEEIAENICAACEKPAVEPYAVFNSAGEPFTYYDGTDGVRCDKDKLLDDISASVNGEFGTVTLRSACVPRKTRRADVERRTVKLYSFTTYFDADNVDRSSNIRLAAQKINGTVVEPLQTFSFNGTVGERTAENGFRQAKIIEGGKFVQGYGGGVCQVSTTLYNAALLSGLEITEYHPHSLQVSYVSPSRDAMVSGNYFDLKFKNNRKTPIYVRVNCNLGSVTCTVYGESDGYNYSFLSKVVEIKPRPEPTVVEGAEDRIISYGRDGTVSEGYLVREGDGAREDTLIRKDSYPAVADVLERRGVTEPPDGTSGTLPEDAADNGQS